MSSVEHRIVESAAALIVGAELLSGKTRDENLFALSNALRALGITLGRVIVCPDDRDIIAADVAALSQAFDLVVTSGGVGPTHDDVTIAGVAQGLGVPVVVSRALADIIERSYGKDTSETHLLMARVPEGALLADTHDVRWPTVVAKNVWILPGVPELFRMKLAVLREHLRGPEPFYTQSVYCDLEETSLKQLLDQVVDAHPGVEVGSYPKWFDLRYKTRLTLDSRSLELTQEAARHLRQLLAEHVVELERDLA